MRKMKALFLVEKDKLELKEVDIPEPTAGYVLVRMHRAGICASDIGYWKRGSSNLELPVILGHEVSGTIEKIGSDVQGLMVGDRVVLMNDFYTCGSCKFCISGDTNMCINRRSLGSKENGAFSEFILAPKHLVLPLSDSLTFEEGAFLEVLACGVHAIHKCGARLQDTVLVSGPGSIGAGAALVAKAMGCNVIMSGLPKDKSRLSVIKSLGVDYVVDDPNYLLQLSKDITSGYGVDIAIEASGSYKSLDTCLQATRKQGQIVQMGVLPGASTLDLSPVMFKELKFFGSYAKTHEAWIVAQKTLVSGLIDVKPLITHTFPLSNYVHAFEKTLDGSGIKIMLCPEE
ncbi:MAG: zinc-dependent alcohol dehydrogenase [Anaerolineaceae bacterium]|jgi:L-iditol 2-dehydrogenase